MSEFILHNYFRSSTSIRLRAALNMKGLRYEYVAYNLRKGEQRSETYLALNPQGLVPSLVLEDGTVLTQSLAIIEYLDEVYPQVPLFPKGALDRARIRALAYAVACDIHPLNNLRVLDWLKSSFAADGEAVGRWFRHWVEETFAPLDAMLSEDARTGRFCHGNAPGLADLCLYSQVINNRRFNIDMKPYPTIARIFRECAALHAFADAAPELQPDAQ